jgi:hypothetical protein
VTLHITHVTIMCTAIAYTRESNCAVIRSISTLFIIKYSITCQVPRTVPGDGYKGASTKIKVAERQVLGGCGEIRALTCCGGFVKMVQMLCKTTQQIPQTVKSGPSEPKRNESTGPSWRYSQWPKSGNAPRPKWWRVKCGCCIPAQWGDTQQQKGLKGTLTALGWGLNICLLPKFIRWMMNSQGNGRMGESLRGNLDMGVEPSWIELVSYKETCKTNPFCHLRTYRECAIYKTVENPPGIESAGTLTLAFNLQTCEKWISVVDKPNDPKYL